MKITPKYEREKHTTWTYKDKKLLHALWKRRLAGERTADLAAELDLKPESLRKQWRELGYDPSSVKQEEMSTEERDRKVYIWKAECSLTYAQCCINLDIKPTKSNRTKLRNRLVAYCEEQGLEFPERDSVDDRNAKVYQWRLEGLSFYEIADKLGRPREPQVRRTLCSSLRYYCKKKGLPYPRTKR